MTKEAVNGMSLFYNSMHLEVKDRLVNCHMEHVMYGFETWILSKRNGGWIEAFNT